jgi:hypothetical protein
VFSEMIVDTSKAPALDLERFNTAPSLPWDLKYQLRKLYGYR